MSFVKILAPLSGGPRDEAVLESAIAAATPFGAHVAALFVRPDPALAMPFYGEGVSSLVVQEVIDASTEASDLAAQRARATLAAVSRRQDIVVTEGPEKRAAATASFRETQGNFADCVARTALLCDLVVFAAPKDDERAGITEALEATLVESRRPVLLCAHPVAPGFHEKIAIGWNGSIASAQAALGALPYLKRAGRVEILSVERAGSACASADVLKTYLGLHGIAAQERKVDAGERVIGDVLLEAAEQSGAGLLVLGGYGHSRLREMFVGGVTRHVVLNAAIPLFLVH